MQHIIRSTNVPCAFITSHVLYVALSSTQVFLKEKERQLLQDTLNKEVMHHIIILQRWFRACHLRLHFLQKKDATLIIQVQFIY